MIERFTSRTVGDPTPRDDRRLRVAVIAETFLPHVNGVTNSVLRVIEHLSAEGHEVLVIAPGPGDDRYGRVPVVRMRGFDVPRYDDLRVALPGRRMSAELRSFGPDVIHLAAPMVLGAVGARVARRLGIPTVAVFQTDVAGFAKRNGLGWMGDGIWNYLRWVHSMADCTLAPSRSAVWTLRSRGIENVELWARGVDLERFHPNHASPQMRRFLSADDEVIVGYVGRLAREKQVERLAPVAARPGVRLVIVGDGPERGSLEAKLSGARFVGFQSGLDLSQLHATFDVFVHPGIDETFCQALQESMASGVASVAPSAGGPLDLVRHGETGFFWSPEAPGTLVEAVDELVRDPVLRHHFGSAARASAEQRPWAAIMDQLVDHYRHLVGRSSLAISRAA